MTETIADKTVVAELAPTGTLRAGINLSNFLLVSGKAPNGDPVGVSPDMAAEIARRLGVPLKLVPFKSPGELADAAGDNVWDIGLIADEPARAAVMAFSPAYVEIEATYMVKKDSALAAIADIDHKGVRIVVPARTAYELWLSRNIKDAELVVTDGNPAAMEQFLSGKADAFAGLKPGLLGEIAKHPDCRLLDGRFTAVQQAIGCGRGAAAGAKFIRAFVEEAKRTGFVQGLIAKHKVVGLSVAA
jgi:polar amino acid transport system substrate-binding protein